jgi:AcrR family transcriptional regulator
MTDMAPTRERIVGSARRLFAERGYRGTSVGEIEAAAGLSPRSGALYKHFPSKKGVLDAVMAQHTTAVAQLRSQLEVMPLGEMRAELTLIGRWALAELRREHELTRIVMKEGDRFPELATSFREAIVGPGHALAVEILTGYAEREGVRLGDPDAVAAMLVSSLVGYTLQEVLFGPPQVDDDRLIAAWVEAATAIVRLPSDERSSVNA